MKCTPEAVPTGTPRTYTGTRKISSGNGVLFTLLDVQACRSMTSVRFKKTGKRNEVFLATKFGFTRNPERFVNGEPEYAKKCIEESLRRLGGKLIAFRLISYTHRASSGLYRFVLFAPVSNYVLSSSSLCGI